MKRFLYVAGILLLFAALLVIIWVSASNATHP